MAPVMPTQTKDGHTLQDLRAKLKARGITQLQIAAAAGVKPPHVCNVLAGRDISAHIVSVAWRLVAKAS